MLVMGVMQNKDHYGSQGYNSWKTIPVTKTKNTEFNILCFLISASYLVVVDILIVNDTMFSDVLDT